MKMAQWDDASWRSQNRIRINIRNVFADVIGEDHGITSNDIAPLVPRLEAAAEEMKTRRNAGELPFLDLPDQDTAAIRDYATGVRDRLDTFVVVGIGGSALGPIACHTALRHPYHNALPASRRDGMRLEVPDNVDPDRLSGLLDTLTPHRTLFNVITKSGSTAETASTFLLIKQWLQQSRWVGDKWREHVVFTTDPEKGDLRKLAGREGITSFDIPPGVGGRFSVLTPVGLLPMAATGIDVDEMLAGARDMVARCFETPMESNPAFVSAAIHYLNYEKGKPLAVMMPYSHGLKDIADWFRQLWAESLGKEKDLRGSTVNVGPTPVKALGVTDQHSQVQLYAEGPNDKLFTFLGVDGFKRDMAFPSDPETADLDAFNYFGGKTMGQLMHAEQAATVLALTRKQRPNMTIHLPDIRPYTIGQILMLLEIQTVATGALMGIDPFDQPGVEAGKVAAYALMERPGYDEERKQIEAEMAAGEDREL
jgi:glucose-6-phosphate isomerase